MFMYDTANIDTVQMGADDGEYIIISYNTSLLPNILYKSLSS